MKRNIVRRLAALAAAAGLCLACAAPVFAEETEWEYLQQVRLESEYGSWIITRPSTELSGPDVQNGELLLEKGKQYELTADAEFKVVKSAYASWGLLACTKLRYDAPLGSAQEYMVLTSDGNTVTFARPVSGSEVAIHMELTDLRLSGNACMRSSDDWPLLKPHLTADVKAQVRCMVEAVAQVPLPKGAVQVDGDWKFPEEETALEYDALVQQALDEPAAQLAQPEEAVLEMTFRGDIPASGINWRSGDRLPVEWRIEYPRAGSGNKASLVWQLQGETYEVKHLEDTPLEFGCSLLVMADDMVSTGIPVREGADTAKRVAATTAGAAALGLGGGAVLNGLSAALENTPFAKRREDYEDPDLAGDTPDLPEEDTPSVSVSFYRPFDDMVNTKGAAVDIQLTVNGGEGLRWHYVPTAICPEGLKAVVPAVVGTSHEATLVLNLTGAKMKKPHIPVFVTVVAWAFDEGGRLLKIPWVIPTVISGLLWAWIYANPYGLLQYVISVVTDGRVTGFGILNNQETAIWGVIIVALWKQIPLITLLLLAGMQNVPEDILEAAKLDGANYLQCLFKIIFPFMRSVIAVTVSLSIIDNFKQYPLFATLTNGGPASATTTLAVLSYDEAFVNYNYGSGAAVTTVWLLLMVVVVFVFNAIFRKKDD